MASAMVDGDSLWMKGSEVGRKNVLEKMFGCAIGGWGVPRGDGCTIGENPLSMVGMFLEGIEERNVFQHFLDSVR